MYSTVTIGDRSGVLASKASTKGVQVPPSLEFEPKYRIAVMPDMIRLSTERHDSEPFCATHFNINVRRCSYHTERSVLIPRRKGVKFSTEGKRKANESQV
jgi:hypothetical protein